MAGIYLHIPFCKQACYYCDFHFSTNLMRMDELTGAICREIQLRNSYLQNRKVDTVYFGGGTPSLLGRKQISQIITAISDQFSLEERPEVTLEANPDDLSSEKLKDLWDVGINRLSIGVQSFQERYLSYMNRAHNSHEAKQSVKEARRMGFENISIDLIFGLPNQNMEDLVADLETALSLEVQHISIYGLTIENNTVFGKWEKDGKLQACDEDLSATYYQEIMARLTTAGYDHYEISNFCLPGYSSRHNTSYWQGIHYLGIGPSAHSYNGVSRQYNVSNNQRYIKAIESGELPHKLEHLHAEEILQEYIYINLRTKWGVDLTHLKNEMTYDLLAEKGQLLRKLEQQQMIVINDGILRLADNGKLVADKIALELLP